MKREPVWITGVGALTPLGHTCGDFADSLLAGKSGVGRITQFNAAAHPAHRRVAYN